MIGDTKLFKKVVDLILNKVEEDKSIELSKLIRYVVKETKNGESVTEDMIKAVISILQQEFRLKLEEVTIVTSDNVTNHN